MTKYGGSASAATWGTCLRPLDTPEIQREEGSDGSCDPRQRRWIGDSAWCRRETGKCRRLKKRVVQSRFGFGITPSSSSVVGNGKVRKGVIIRGIDGTHDFPSTGRKTKEERDRDAVIDPVLRESEVRMRSL